MKTALILTEEEQPFDAPDLLLLWDTDQPPNGFSGRWISLPSEVSANRINLRAQYATWIEAMGTTPVRGRSLAERLVIEPGLSYWWMTAPAEYPFEESSLAYTVLRLMAVTDVVQREGIRKIASTLTSEASNGTLDDWCQRTGRSFVHSTSQPRHMARSTQAVKDLLNAARRWLRASRDSRPTHSTHDNERGDRGSDSVLIVDYLAHVGHTRGRPHSHYWASLPEVMRARGARIAWLHLFVPTMKTPKTADALTLAQQLPLVTERHDIAQTSINARALLGALITYLRICRLRLSFVRYHPQVLVRGLNPSLLIRENTRDHFLGLQAMDNALWLRIFDNYLKKAPTLRLGLYLQENQPWELAFLYAWRRYNHGTVMGVQHTTVRFWDFRYLKQAETEQSPRTAMPKPDVTVLNGDGALTALAGFSPLGKHVKVAEATRFLESESDVNDVRNEMRTGPPCLLLVVEYDPGYADRQARLTRSVCRVAEVRGEELKIVWRPHPASTRPLPELPSSVIVDQDTSIDQLLIEADVAMVGNFSSTILRAQALGTSIVRLPSPRTLGNEPEDSGPSALPITTPNLLIDLLLRASMSRKEQEDGSSSLISVFALNPDLPLWRDLLDAVYLTDSG